MRKYGAEPAQVEVRADDNDLETLSSLKDVDQETVGRHRRPECDDSDGQIEP